MNCSNCKHDFCWLCLTEWSKHGSRTGGYYSCNIYDNLKKSDKEFEDFEKKMQDSRNELEVYGFHFERYTNHSKAGDLMKNQIPNLREVTEKMHEIKNYPVSETAFLEDCAKTIIECRQILKWTYPVGFYGSSFLDSKQLELFKYQQSLLEEECEKTQELLE